MDFDQLWKQVSSSSNAAYHKTIIPIELSPGDVQVLTKFSIIAKLRIWSSNSGILFVIQGAISDFALINSRE